MKSKTLTRSVFQAIRNELLGTDRHQTDIAVDYKVSASSVSTVNNEGTWENHLSHKNGTKTLRQRRKVTVAAQTKRELADNAGLTPHDATDRLEEKFATELRELEKRFRVAIDDTEGLLSNRLDAQYVHIQGKQDEGDIAFWQVAVDVILIVAVILIAVVK